MEECIVIECRGGEHAILWAWDAARRTCEDLDSTADVDDKHGCHKPSQPRPQPELVFLGRDLNVNTTLDTPGKTLTVIKYYNVCQ
mmetsp:Transcript_12581/g.23562  ORF Transcript_12581/g.23562 Transcript_12581/m.23562 type:complete len:85 (+) Transcript_12581:290-544(+)